MSFEPLTAINFPEIGLRGQFYTSVSPVVAWGTYKDKSWHFRAKYEHWDFVLSPFPHFRAEDISDLCGYDLELMRRSEKPFPEGMIHAFQNSFVLSGEYGTPGSFAAGNMSPDEAVRIIRECIVEYERD